MLSPGRTCGTDVADSQAAAFAELALCFLVDAAFPGPGAGESYTVTIAADGNRFEERSIENILKNCPVKIGGGKQTVMLYDLMPNMVVQDFMSICERYADDM